MPYSSQSWAGLDAKEFSDWDQQDGDTGKREIKARSRLLLLPPPKLPLIYSSETMRGFEAQSRQEARRCKLGIAEELMQHK